MKMVKITPMGKANGQNKKMWVKESNPYFKWYMDSPDYRKGKVIEV